MAVAYEYTEEMKNQLDAIRNDKVAFRKLRRKFRKELGIHNKVSSNDKSTPEVKDEVDETNTESKAESSVVESDGTVKIYNA